MKYFIASFGLLVVGFLVTYWYWIAHKATISGNLAQVRSPLIVFDFDGTICPSFPLFIEQVNVLADEYKLRKIKKDEADDFRGMSPKNIMKTLGVSMFKLPFLLKKARRNVQKQLLELKPVPGVEKVLKELNQRGCSLGILTSNSAENVLLYLQKYNINFFDFIYAGNNVFGKEGHLKIILKKTHLNPQKNRVIYIGDESRDMEAARQAQFASIGVTWGYNSSNLLRESNPDFLCETPSQLLLLIDAATDSKKGAICSF